MDREALARAIWEIHGDPDEPYDPDWIRHEFCEQALEHDWILEEWRNETDSGNFACGDESERLFSMHEDGLSAYFIETSSGGFDGPFATYDEAVAALGYDPATFDPSEGMDEDEDEDEEEEEEEENDER